WHYYFNQENDDQQDSNSEKIILTDTSHEGKYFKFILLSRGFRELIEFSIVGGDMYEKWIKSEDLHNSQLLSIRSGDEMDVEDPYRVILFDDIRTFFFDLTSPQSRKEFIYSCFAFVGLTFNPGYSSSNPLVLDTFLNSKLINKSIANACFWTADISFSHEFKFPLKAFPQDDTILFPSRD
ncbi:691_t:CDS:2, partial [Acaulospora morrowiae]